MCAGVVSTRTPTRYRFIRFRTIPINWLSVLVARWCIAVLVSREFHDSGAEDGTRTHSLMITNQLRCQLRHSGTCHSYLADATWHFCSGRCYPAVLASEWLCTFPQPVFYSERGLCRAPLFCLSCRRVCRIIPGWDIVILPEANVSRSDQPVISRQMVLLRGLNPDFSFEGVVIFYSWSRKSDSNRWPAVCETAALLVELFRHIG